MIKKITAIILSVLIVVALTTAAAFAADPKEKAPVVSFDTNGSGWEGFSQVYCHIYEYGGNDFFEWQTKKEKCSDADGDGIWTYDLAAKGVALADGKMYCVIFSAENKSQTYDLLMDASCYEDTAAASGEHVENPTDSTKHADVAYWNKSDPEKYGPLLKITSIGNVVGAACPPGVTEQDIFKDFLINDLENARTYSGLSDQELVDNIAAKLPLTVEQAQTAIEEAGVEVDWQPSSPATPDQPTVPPTEPPTEEPTLPPSTGILGDVDCDGVVTVLDATLIQKYKAHMIDEKRLDLSVADVDGDGVVTVLDATRIQKYKAGLCDLEGDTTRSENALYFDPASAGWKNCEFIGFHILSASGEAITEFGSDAEKAEKNPDGTYRMDAEDIAADLDGEEQLLIVFYNDKGDTTYELVFDKSCLGDIARCGANILDKPSALWKDQDKTVCGPKLMIGPAGSVIGNCIPKGCTPYTVLYDFFRDGYTEAVSRSGKTSQKMIDDIAQQIGIRYQYEISVAIVESGTNVTWTPANCPLPMRAA